MNNHSWFDYWENQKLWREHDWNVNIEQFVKTLSRIHELKKSDSVLDIGCGEGYLEESIWPQVKTVWCMDTSHRAISVCQKKFDHNNTIHPLLLDQADYTNFNMLKSQKFSLIICLSVIQYYDHLSKVEELLMSIRNHALPGATCIIADIIVSDNPMKDAYHLLIESIKHRCFGPSIAWLIRARFSDYYRVRRRQGLLTIPSKQLMMLVKKHHLNGYLVNMPLTLNTNRQHLVIKF